MRTLCHLPWSLVVLCASSVIGLVEQRAFPAFNEEQLSTLASPDPIAQLDPRDPNSHLSRILIPRPPDTANNTLVKNYIVSTLRALSWTVEEDTFTSNTPLGEKQFTNVIATKDPVAPSRFVLSAHFDSKWFDRPPANQFVGATDSAAPCALMLDLAEVLNPHLDRRKERAQHGEAPSIEAEETTLTLIFFDGEEAFHDWTSTDSVYGSRHLAEKWSKTYFEPPSGLAGRRLNPPQTFLNMMEVLVLLDLLGAANPSITSYFPDTGWLFDALISAQNRLGEAGFLDADEFVEAGLITEEKAKWEVWNTFFIDRKFTGAAWRIEDDHVPFLKRGVPILHVITNPFPRVWHSLADDASALDLPTLKRWSLIFRLFTAEYLRLPVPRTAQPPEEGHDELG